MKKRTSAAIDWKFCSFFKIQNLSIPSKEASPNDLILLI
jgi:hypothetical protein